MKIGRHKLHIGVALLLLCVACSFLGNKNASAYIDKERYELKIENKNLDIKVNALYDDNYAIVKDAVKMSTSSPTGFSLYISSASDTNTIKIENLPEESNTKFIAVPGTIDAPVSLSDQQESSWGFAIPGFAGFDQSYDSENPSPASKFAAMPVVGDDILIHSHSGEVENLEMDIYYGFKINQGQQSGKYDANIVYTSVVEITPNAYNNLEVIPNDIDISDGPVEVEIRTSLNITTENYEIRGPFYVTMNYGYNENYYGLTRDYMVENGWQEPDIERFTKSDSYYAFICEDPVLTSKEPVTVKCTVPKNDIRNGRYDVYLDIPYLGKTYSAQKALNIRNQYSKEKIAYFDANGGHDAPVPQESYTCDYLPNYIPWREGHRFLGWDANKDVETPRYVFEYNEVGGRDGNFYEEMDGYRDYWPNYCMGDDDQWITFYAIWEPVNPVLTLEANGGTETKTFEYHDYSFKLPNYIPTREDFIFAGWSLKQKEYVPDYIYNSETGTFTYCAYDNSYDHNYTCEENKLFKTYDDVTLYAVWHRPEIHNIADAKYMQDVGNEVQGTMEEGVQYQLLDARDGKKYWISKLADGNVWMTQNLDLEFDTSKTEYYGPMDSNLSTTTKFNVGTTWSNSSDDANQVYQDGGDYYYDENYELKSASGLADDSELLHRHVGNYYSYTTTTGSPVDEYVYEWNKSIYGYNYSICPRGWSLPHNIYTYSPWSSSSSLYQQTQSFGLLTNAYGVTNNYRGNDGTLFEQAPLYFVKGGGINMNNDGSNTLSEVGEKGYYSASNTTSLMVGDTVIDPFSSNHPGSGAQIRCVATYKSRLTLNYNYENSPEPKNIYTEEEYVDVLDEKPQREGYRFAGWSYTPDGAPAFSVDEDINYTNHSSSFLNGRVYIVGEQAKHVDADGHGTTLYAVWEDPTTRIMQDVQNWKDSVAVGQEVRAVDRRDEKIYIVKKMEDGTIWMVQNLDFDLDIFEHWNMLDEFAYLNDNNDTAVRSMLVGSMIHGYNNLSSGWNRYRGDIGFDPGDYYYDGAAEADSSCNYVKSNCEHFSTEPFESNGEKGHVGNYYSWGRIMTYNNLYSGNSYDQSICPHGWGIPENSTASGYGVPDWQTALNNNNLELIRTGYVNKNGAVNAGASGYYAERNQNASYFTDSFYALKFNNNLSFSDYSVSPESTLITVRCYARDSVEYNWLRN